MYVKQNEWQELPKGTAGFGRYELVKPELLMWETPQSVPMSVTGSDAAAWNGLGGFGEGPSTGDVAAAGVGLTVGALAVYGLTLLMLGGAIIWVVKSVRKE